MKQAQAIRQEREDAEHKRKMEEEAAARSHEITLTQMEQKHQEEMRRMFQNMSAEQIMAANPDITPEAAAALAEKFKSENSAEQIALMKEHKDEIIRQRLGLTTLRFNKLETLVKAIGLPKCKLCTHCFDGSGCCGCGH